ncbi:hypothetical protein ALO_17196 [Acetonema longum DSM 6540]|uniref:Uncharacterized protein n=1 Tax=Acetonema longum DSM 6540 TaxID=1009370 RepID=F7NMV6_9FIRM|nr:hypothetical protein ALO_17196 [Acetonema longum DSM 6540]
MPAKAMVWWKVKVHRARWAMIFRARRFFLIAMGSPRFNGLERQEELKAVGLIGGFKSLRFV